MKTRCASKALDVAHFPWSLEEGRSKEEDRDEKNNEGKESPQEPSRLALAGLNTPIP